MLKPSQNFFVQRKEKILQKKSFFQKSGKRRIERKKNEGFLTVLAMAIKKDPTMSIRKRANELKVHEKTVRTVIKQDLSPDVNPLDDAIWVVLENETNTTSHPNIGSLKTVIEEEWN